MRGVPHAAACGSTRLRVAHGLLRRRVLPAAAAACRLRNGGASPRQVRPGLRACALLSAACRAAVAAVIVCGPLLGIASAVLLYAPAGGSAGAEAAGGHVREVSALGFAAVTTLLAGLVATAVVLWLAAAAEQPCRSPAAAPPPHRTYTAGGSLPAHLRWADPLACSRISLRTALYARMRFARVVQMPRASSQS